METRKVKEIIMFDVYQNNNTKPKSFKIFVNDDDRDRTLIHNTVITVLKLIGAVSVKRIIDNKVFFMHLIKGEENVVQISKIIAIILYDKICNNEFEIWI